MSPLGRVAEEARQEFKPAKACPREAGPAAEGTNVQTLGMFRILWPRQQLLEQTARSVCRQLVERWMTKDAKPLRNIVKDWVRKLWEEYGLSQEKVIGRYQETCDAALKQTPEAFFAAVADPLTKLAAAKTKAKDAVRDGAVQMTAVVEGIDHLEKALGIPEECKSVQAGKPSVPPGFLEHTLQEFAQVAVNEYEQKIAKLIVRLIESPDYRLAGGNDPPVRRPDRASPGKPRAPGQGNPGAYRRGLQTASGIRRFASAHDPVGRQQTVALQHTALASAASIHGRIAGIAQDVSEMPLSMPDFALPQPTVRGPADCCRTSCVKWISAGPASATLASCSPSRPFAAPVLPPPGGRYFRRLP